MAGPDTSSAVRRCPSCGARNRGSEDWCTLCHGSLNGPPTPTIAESLAELINEPDAEAAPGHDDPDGHGDPDGHDDPDGADDSDQHGPGPASGPDPVLVNTLMLQLAAQESGIRLPGRMAALRGLLGPGAPPGRALVIGLIGLVGVAAVVTALLALVGLAL
jgi:hypothetical protein